MNTLFVVAHPKPGVTEFLGCAFQIAFVIWFFARRHRLGLQLLCLVARILSSFLAGYEFYGVAEFLIMATINHFVG